MFPLWRLSNLAMETLPAHTAAGAKGRSAVAALLEIRGARGKWKSNKQ